MPPIRTTDGDLVGRTVPYAAGAPATPLEGDAMDGPIRTGDGDLVGRTALYSVSGDVATPITSLGVDPATVGQPGGPAGPLDGSGHLPTDQIPPSLLHTTFEATSEAEMLAEPALAPSLCVRTDQSPPHIWFLHTDPASTLGNWEDLGQLVTSNDDPSAQVGLNPVNGSAATTMRSDAAPSLDQGITPTWTGSHTFARAGGGNVSAVQTQGAVAFEHTAGAADAKWWDIITDPNKIAFRAVNDANSASQPFLTVTRSGLTIQQIEFGVNGDVVMTVKPDEMILSPSTIDNGKIRLWDSNGNENQFYGFGVNSGLLRFQVDTVNSDHVFYAATAADASQELFRIAGDKTLTAQGDLHMSEQKVVNVGDPDSARDATNKTYVDSAIAGVSGISSVVTHDSGNSVTLTDTDPEIQLIDAFAASGDFTVTLPGNGSTVGKTFVVKKVDGVTINAVNITPSDGQQIDGSLNAVALTAQWSLLTLVFDGSNWQVTGAYSP